MQPEVHNEFDPWSPEALKARLSRERRTWRWAVAAITVALGVLSIAMVMAGRNPLEFIVPLVLMVPYFLVRVVLKRYV